MRLASRKIVHTSTRTMLLDFTMYAVVVIEFGESMTFLINVLSSD